MFEKIQVIVSSEIVLVDTGLFYFTNSARFFVLVLGVFYFFGGHKIQVGVKGG